MLYWKSHIDQILPKLIAACCGVLKAFMIQETSVMVYRGYFHLIMNYGNIFGIFSIQYKYFPAKKKAIRITASNRNTESCRDPFKALNILPLQSQYIFSLCFVVLNMDQYKFNADINGKCTRQSSNLHQTASKLLLYKRYLAHGH